jgi:hypothetical protein
MFSVCVCVCVFLSVCVQVEALRRPDHPPKESYRLENRSKTESFMEVGQGPNWGCSAKKKFNSSVPKLISRQAGVSKLN